MPRECDGPARTDAALLMLCSNFVSFTNLTPAMNTGVPDFFEEYLFRCRTRICLCVGSDWDTWSVKLIISSLFAKTLDGVGYIY